MNRAWPSLCLALILVAGCAKSPRAHYLDALHEQTRLGVVYDTFGTALRVRATMLTPSFREQLAAERARLLGEADPDPEAFRQRMSEDARVYHEVVFTAESNIEPRLRFGTDDNTWRLRLLADGVEQPFVTVYEVRRPTSLHHALYAHKNLWNTLWIARFERTTTAPTNLKLVVGGGYGHTELSW